MNIKKVLYNVHVRRKIQDGCPKWPPKHKIDPYSLIIYHKRILMVSNPMFSGPRNSVNMIKIYFYNDKKTYK